MTAFVIQGNNATIHCNHTNDSEGIYVQLFHYTNISGISFVGCKGISFQSIHTLVIANCEILQLESYSHSFDEYIFDVYHWNLSHILNATLLGMTFRCKNTLNVEWSSLVIKQCMFIVAVACINQSDVIITRSNFTSDTDLAFFDDNKSALRIWGSNWLISISESL